MVDYGEWNGDGMMVCCDNGPIYRETKSISTI